MRTRPRALAAALSVALVAASLAACAADSNESGNSLSIVDPWVKTAEAGGMTAAFGTLENPTDADITVTSASTDAAGMVELHEVVDGSMQPKEGGFVVPAGGSLTLEPGGLHIMLMDLPADIAAGEDITVTLETSAGTAVEFTAPAKDFDGANEDYDGGSDMDGMDMDTSMEPSDG